MDREVHIEQKVVDGQEALVVSLPGADDDELGEMFEKLAIIRGELLPEAVLVEGVLILRFLTETQPILLDVDPRYLNEDGDLSIILGDNINLKDLGHYENEDGEDVTFQDAFTEWAEKALQDPRRGSRQYPHTYAADLVRMHGPNEGVGLQLSRSDASQLNEMYAKALGISKARLSELLADYYLTHEDELVAKSVERATEAWET